MLKGAKRKSLSFEIKQYSNSLDKIKNKKARKTYEAFCNFNLL